MDDLIVSDPEVMLGKPVIRGTRVTVESILERLGAGESEADLAASHPRVDAAAIRACLRYAARAMHAEISYPYSARS
ncbi:MAG TPA: DUF433 domain-containing protein [Planctomycetes bacterium]|nr:DUF433 domain-containing protein [Planctomycetota bacterium]